jgi:hypothetical protein
LKTSRCTDVADRKPGRPKKADEAKKIEATRTFAPVKALAKKAMKKNVAKKGK